MDDQEHFLLELLHLEGRSDFLLQEACQGSAGGMNAPEFRCEDCLGTELYCKACTVERHIENPTHRIEYWNSQHFEDTNLQDLGLQVQLGHPPGERCSNPSLVHNNFVVLNINGVHNITLHFCKCQTAQSHMTQLLHMCWFPATTLDSKTTTTFQLLHHFHILSFKSKASTFEYWQTLTCLTNNTAYNGSQDRYNALLQMGHDPGEVEVTQHGACAVLCPACPQLGKNLLNSWEDTLFEERWKYSLFLAIDANFRLACKNISSDKTDPSLNKGWAYFVKEKAFKKFLHDTGKQPQEKSSCASHNAVNLAETKNSCGLAVMGAGTVDCSCHNMKCPCSVGDLQKGERYINMDYLFFSTLQYSKDVVTLNVSYNIACQWSKNIWDHMATYPHQMHVECSTKEFVFLVPKFHLPVHVAFCQVTYSHNLIKGMGRTNGEAPERRWANINPVATSTWEMGPGSCCNTLDNHFGDFNWKKEVARWKLAIEGWEANRSQTNPFKVTTTTVRLHLSQKEAEDLEHGLNYSLHMEVSSSILVSLGIEIEDQQHQLEREYAALGPHSMDLQLTKLQEQSNALQCKIKQWCKVQVLYMPTVIHVRTSNTASTISSQEEKPYKVKLYEWELQQAQAYDTLDDLCRHLQLRSHLYKFKANQLCGQQANTRAAGVLAKVELSIKTDAEQYHQAWTALVILGNILQEHSWRDDLLKLEPEHVQGMSDGHVGQSKGNQTLSWIWKACGITTGDREGETVLADALHVEWCKSWACTHHWTEEVELLQEEMWCVCMFFNWHMTWWKDLASWRIGLDIAELEGLEAYAKCQVALQIMMQDNCLRKWCAVPVASLPPAVVVP
ncbi:uncharacterized protein BJ212DRAFT_1447709 [Suillus subaureus]|uniref:CxC2-like cysteine cluster KDZ transposase-associated domain-containing protein n=1 Tax=Suillus subaureus TaxID=48587 RepID=A0A9P7JCA2_9AGAM|nr:uncharacterized protein BJ212DRAFT_1447709 [Suillus subaureus]KAG1813923.1 hypothetical protein BJ212DRAFT_1447709 [Suillus subaureus]